MRIHLTFTAFLLSSVACQDYGYTPVVEGVDDGAPTCPADVVVDFAPPATLPCEQPPVVGSFEPVVEWAWQDNPFYQGYHQVMAAPAVGNLDDDNGDGVVDERDIPDIVFTAFVGGDYASDGAVVAVSGSDGHTLWSVMDAAGHFPSGAAGVALARLDGEMAVFVATADGLLCLDADGSFRWYAGVASDRFSHPAVADVDGDGRAEIVFGLSLLDADGAVLWSHGPGARSDFASFAMDLDADGKQEVITATGVYGYDGAVRWSDGDVGWPAVADLDRDGQPEVIRVHSGRVSAVSAEGTPIWEARLADGRGGPPTVADFDGDGLPEIGVASREYYRVLDGDGTELWANRVQDFSSSVTGSSVFDFEGDGAAEVVYADEETLWIYDGATGTVELAWSQHSSGTLMEYPLIVDIDQDGSAEIVVASNDYSAYNDSHGITVIGDVTSSWSAARPIWNQFAYSIQNVLDDGTVPALPRPNWMARNSFRAGNSETRTGSSQPDLQLGAPHTCMDTCETGTFTLHVPVANAGPGPADAHTLALYALEGGEQRLVRTLDVQAVPALSTRTVGPIELQRDDFGLDGLLLRVDDDGAQSSRVDECDEDNNAWTLANFPCF